MKILDIIRHSPSVDSATLVDQVLELNLSISFSNPYSYLMTRKHDFEVLDRVYIDGFLMVMILRLLQKKVGRLSMDYTSIAPILFRQMIEKSKRLYVIGTTEQKLEQTVNHLRERHHRLQIVGHQHGYISNREVDAIKSILDSKPDVVLIGMGAPLQEQFSEFLRKNGYKGAIVTCGGFLEQISKTGDYYPAWIDKTNLRFAYRMFDQPTLIKRYFLKYPLAIYFIFKDWFQCHSLK